MFKLNAKSDADSLLYSLSHFECDCHTLHMPTQWCLLPPLSSTVQSSSFTRAHSSPLSLAARLHQCHANHFGYINNGWTFSGLCVYVCVYTHLCMYVCMYVCSRCTIKIWWIKNKTTSVHPLACNMCTTYIQNAGQKFNMFHTLYRVYEH